MGTTVSEVKSGQETKVYTDQSGCLKEGMRTKDLKMSIFERILYNTTPEKDIARLDKDRDGVFSHDEISEEIERDIAGNKRSIKWQSGLGLANAILSFGIRKSSPRWSKIGLLSAVFSLGLAAYSKYKVNDLEQRLERGYN